MQMRAKAAALATVLVLALPSVPRGQGHSGDVTYQAIDGGRLKTYVDAQTAISRSYRDRGHPQFWGRIIGTEADAENARWLMDRLKTAGVTDVREQPFDLPPQWMPQSWSVTATAGAKTLALSSAQPTYRGVATPAGGLDLEAVDVGFATDADLARQDLKGKAVFFYSTDFQSRHVTISHGAVKRITDRGAAAIFITLLIPGNMHFQFYPVASTVPTFVLGSEDGLRMRDAITEAPAGSHAHVKLSLDVSMTPSLKTATVWGTLPGLTDETVVIVAHRDGWFEGANDNASGVATMLGLAEYFAKVPREQRRRTIVFLGTSGHHDGTAESGTWLSQHPETFAKTALLINCEHTAANLLISSNNNVIHSASVESPMSWYIGGSPKLAQIVTDAYRMFDVKLMAERSGSAAGEIGRIQNLAPSLQLIDTGLYWHSDKETSDLIPASGLQAVTRAYAKIITDTGSVPIKDLQK
jgi:hypothetical protein